MSESKLYPWVDGKVPRGFWEKEENRRQYMIWLGKKLGFFKLEDWYQIASADFSKNYGIGLLFHFNGSPSLAVKEFYPNYDWKPWKFKVTPNGFWKQAENRKKYMIWLGERLGFFKKEDWYQITQKKFRDNYGGGLLPSYFNDSPFQAIKELYPNYDWLPWKVAGRVSSKFWKNQENRRQYMFWLGKELKFSKKEDWWQITQKDFHNNYGGGLLSNYFRGSISRAVKELYPGDDWKALKFNNKPKRKL